MASSWLETMEEWGEWASEQLWGPSPKDVIRRSQAQIRNSIRKLEREKEKMKKDEIKFIENLRAAAQTARRPEELKTLALTIARCRRGTQRVDSLIFSLNGMNQDLLESSTHAEMHSVMVNVTNALMNVNSVGNGINGISNVLRQYDRQKQTFEMTKDMVESNFDEEAETEDADTLLMQLDDELHLNISGLLPSAKVPVDYEILNLVSPPTTAVRKDPPPPTPPPPPSPPPYHGGTPIPVEDELKQRVKQLMGAAAE